MINFTFVKYGFKRAGFGDCTSKIRQKLHSSCLHYNIHVIINVWFTLKRWNTTVYSRKKEQYPPLELLLIFQGFEKLLRVVTAGNTV